jgi:hypothetical protein
MPTRAADKVSRAAPAKNTSHEKIWGSRSIDPYILNINMRQK